MKSFLANNCKPKMKPKIIRVKGSRVLADNDPQGNEREILLSKKLFRPGSYWLNVGADGFGI